MRIFTLGILCFSCSITLGTQAQTMQPQRPPTQDGGTREVLESIVIPPIPNQPFSATLPTGWIRYTGDGGTITLVNERPIARDSKDRICRERWLLVPKYGKVKSQMNWIHIADPKTTRFV